MDRQNASSVTGLHTMLRQLTALPHSWVTAALDGAQCILFCCEVCSCLYTVHDFNLLFECCLEITKLATQLIYFLGQGLLQISDLLQISKRSKEPR